MLLNLKKNQISKQPLNILKMDIIGIQVFFFFKRKFLLMNLKKIIENIII